MGYINDPNSTDPKDRALAEFLSLAQCHFDDKTAATLQLISVRRWIESHTYNEGTLWKEDIRNADGSIGPFHLHGDASVEDERYLYWVHIPFANGPAVMATARAIGLHLGKNNTEGLVSSSFEQPGVLPMDSSLAYRDPLHQRVDRSDYVAVVFPVLTVCTSGDLKIRDKMRKEIKTHFRSQDRSENYNRIGIHFSRTLDEAYYPGLDADILRRRNTEQVISREYMANDHSDHENSRPILMVQHLWFFKIENVLMTAFEIQRGDSLVSNLFEQDQIDVRGTGSRPIWVPPKNMSESNLDMQMASMMLAHIDDFGRPQKKDRHTTILAPLDIYERAVISTFTKADRYSRMDPGSLTLGQAKRIERDIIFDIADIRDELVMIESVLERQRVGLIKFMRSLSGNHTPERQLNDGASAVDAHELPAGDKAAFHDGIRLLDRYLARVKKISGDAERIQVTMDNMLDMKRANASVEDAKSSLLIGVAALGFAVVTIIFTPLAFVTGLLTLPTQELRRHQNSGVYSDGYVGGLFVGVEISSLLLTAATVWLILKYFDLFPKGRTPKRDNKSPRGDPPSASSTWRGDENRDIMSGAIKEDEGDTAASDAASVNEKPWTDILDMEGKIASRRFVSGVQSRSKSQASKGDGSMV